MLTFDALQEWRLVGRIPAAGATEQTQQSFHIHQFVTSVVHHSTIPNAEQ